MQHGDFLIVNGVPFRLPAAEGWEKLRWLVKPEHVFHRIRFFQIRALQNKSGKLYRFSFRLL